MEDDELAQLRLAALKTLTKKNCSPNRSKNLPQKTSPDRYGPRGPRYHPRPTNGSVKSWHNNFSNHPPRGFNHNVPTNFARSYRSNLSNLVVLQNHGEQRSPSRQSSYNRPPASNGNKPVSSSPDEKRVLPGRFARLNDDSSDSDADDRLDESESDAEESKPHSFADESSASNFDFGSKDLPSFSEPNTCSADESNDSDIQNDIENKTLNDVNSEVDSDTSNVRLSPIQVASTPETVPNVLINDATTNGYKNSLANDAPSAPSASPSKNNAKAINEQASNSGSFPNESNTSDSSQLKRKIKLVVDKTEDAMAKRRQKFGEVTPLIKQERVEKQLPRKRVSDDKLRDGRVGRRTVDTVELRTARLGSRQRPNGGKIWDKLEPMPRLEPCASSDDERPSAQKMRSLVVLKVGH